MKELNPVELTKAILDGTIKTYSSKEVAEMLHVTTKTVFNWTKSGALKRYKIKHTNYILEEDLNEFIATFFKAQR